MKVEASITEREGYEFGEFVMNGYAEVEKITIENGKDAHIVLVGIAKYKDYRSADLRPFSDVLQRGKVTVPGFVRRLAGRRIAAVRHSDNDIVRADNLDAQIRDVYPHDPVPMQFAGRSARFVEKMVKSVLSHPRGFVQDPDITHPAIEMMQQIWDEKKQLEARYDAEHEVQ